MSAQLKSFEGPDVQRLLDQIRVEVGPGAKIDGAEKIRVGGVMGFFAKEHYRVVVAVPETAGAGSTAEPTAAIEPPVTTTDVFSAMAEATDDVNDIGAAVSTPVAVAVGGTGAEEPARPEDPPVTESFDAVLTRVASTLDGDPVGPGTGYGTNGNGNGIAPEPELAVPEEALPDIAAGAALFLAEASSPAPGSGPVLPAAGAADDAELALMEALRRTGLDDSVVEAVADGLHRGENLDAALLAAFGSLSPAPALPKRIGSLLVVVGPGSPAKRLAGALAGEMGIDGAAIPFASRDAGAHVHGTGRLLVRTVEDAAEAAPGWRRSSPAVVVVDATVGGPDRGWARDLIAAVRPTAVWGVVEATAKSEDIAAWAHDLGGLDALALENLTATVSPASALGTGVAVARLDGQPASASRWVATIVDRVDPCT